MSRVLDLVIAWPSIAVCVGASLLTGCGPGGIGNDEFRVTAIDYDGGTTLRLTFSSPVANADAIDPNDFRLSIARTTHFVDGPYVYEYTFYENPVEYVYPPGVLDPVEFVSVSLGASATELVLELDQPIPSYACESITYFEQSIAYYLSMSPGSKADAGLFLHYGAGDIPLTGSNGQVLADIGRDWVLNEENYVWFEDSYGFNQLTPRLEIPCN